MSRNTREGRYLGRCAGSTLRLRGHLAPPHPVAFEAYCLWMDRHNAMPRWSRRLATSKYYVTKAQVARLQARMLAGLEHQR